VPDAIRGGPARGRVRSWRYRGRSNTASSRCHGRQRHARPAAGAAGARRYNAHFEQSIYNNKLNIRIGQLAADVEFFDSQTDDLFINGTFGWPAIKASNLPAGGPAPPIAVPGIRVKAELTEEITVFGAVFNGNAARPGDRDPQLRDNHGLAFRVNDPPWFVGQLRFNYDIDIGGRPLAGNFTPGGWYHTVRRSAVYRGGPVDRRYRRNRHCRKTTR